MCVEDANQVIRPILTDPFSSMFVDAMTQCVLLTAVGSRKCGIYILTKTLISITKHEPYIHPSFNLMSRKFK